MVARKARFVQLAAACALEAAGVAVGEAAPLLDAGLDSLSAVEFRNLLQGRVGPALRLPATLVFDYPTIGAIAEYLARASVAVVEASPTTAAVVATRGGVAAPLLPGVAARLAVVGMACQLPGHSGTPEQFWTMLEGKVDCVGDVPFDRFDVEALFDPKMDVPGKMYVRPRHHTQSFLLFRLLIVSFVFSSSLSFFEKKQLSSADHSRLGVSFHFS